METKNKGLLIALMVVAGMGMAPRAHAEEGGGARDPDGSSTSGPPGLAGSSTTAPPREYEHYWRQNLAIDAASAALMVSVFVVDDYTDGESVPIVLLTSGVAGYLLGSPVVHAAHHGNLSRAGLSLLLRGGLPVAGLYLGRNTVRCPPSSPDTIGTCGVSEMLIGGAIGLGTALLIDYGWLARKRIERAPASGLSIVPSMSADRDAFTLGLAGHF